jgi:hypothetical protein
VWPEQELEDIVCDVTCAVVHRHWECETFIVDVLRSVARRRLVKTENSSACATVNCKLCKSVIGLY